MESKDNQSEQQPTNAEVQPPMPAPTTGAQATTPATTVPPASSTNSSVGQQEQRGTVTTIHYTLSYFVRNAEKGPRGAIVLLHDLPGGAFTWADALPKLASSGRAVYAFDMLGYGQSDHPWPSDTSIWGHADNLSYALKRLGLTNIVLVGFGLGGAVAQVLATRLYREEVAKLVLINTYAYLHAFAPNWPLPEMTKRQDPEAPLHTPTDQVMADLRQTLPMAAANTKYLAGSKLDAYVNEWDSNRGKELLFQHIRLLNANYMNSISSNLRMLEIPTLVIWGERDTITPLSLGERLERDILDAKLEIVQGAGHLILDDAAATVATLVANFAGAPSLAAAR